MSLTVVHLHHLADLPHANTMLRWAHIRDQDSRNHLQRSHKAHHRLSHSVLSTLIMWVLALLCYPQRRMG